ncbi:hypothetical protein C8J57DRAFT_97106 [Mycena rebaudengoi]|nr:hypothetical protein C8J57DRAFT_97106 [Mycena rebaudengoi]
MLDGLITDLLLYIFAFTDVYTLLSLARVNKSFYFITLTKELWIPIVHDLCIRGLSDFPANMDLKALSTDALVEEVKRAVVGPHTWSPGREAAPDSSRGATRLAFTPGEAAFRQAHWLPSGRHVLIEVADRIGNLYVTNVEFWEVNPSRKLWTDLCMGIVEEVVFDFRQESKAVVSLMMASRGVWYIIVLEVDLSTGISSKALELAPTPHWLTRMRISGDYLGVLVSH